METYKNLIEQIEAKFGTKISNVKEIKVLKNLIETSIDKEISYNTLRRFFGFLPSTKPSINSLNKLSEFIGYKDYYHFTNFRDYTNWEVWIRIVRIKQQESISKNDINFLNSLIPKEKFISYFIDLLNHFTLTRNIKSIKSLFTINLEKIDRVELLKISLSEGMLMRTLYKTDFSFLEQVIKIDLFRRIVVYNFIDYSFLNMGYLELLEQSAILEKKKKHQLFLSIILLHAKFLNGKKVKLDELVYNLEEYSNTYPIVQGRYFAYLFTSAKRQEQNVVFEKMIHYCKYINKSEFYFEVIPILILLKRIDLISDIFSKYSDDIFEINNYNKFTHQSLFQVAKTLGLIKNGRKMKAEKELESINYDLAFDSYIDYTRLFYLIAKYQLVDNKEEIENEYLEIAKRTKMKRFDLELLRDYF